MKRFNGEQKVQDKKNLKQTPHERSTHLISSHLSLNREGRRGFTNDFAPSSPLLHCPLGLGELQARPLPGVVFPPLPLSALSSSPLSSSLAGWLWPVQMNGRHVHTTACGVYSRWSGGLRVVRLPAGAWHGLSRWQHGLCMRCYKEPVSHNGT